MADYFPAEITIGGKIIEANLRILVNAMMEDCVKSEYGGDCVSIDLDSPLASQLQKLVDDDGFIYVCDNQAKYGSFDNIESACIKLGLDYSRHSDAYAEYDAEDVEFREGMKQPAEFFTDNYYHRLIGESYLRNILDLLEKLDVDAAKDVICKVLGDNIRKMEKFLIIP